MQPKLRRGHVLCVLWGEDTHEGNCGRKTIHELVRAIFFETVFIFRKLRKKIFIEEQQLSVHIYGLLVREAFTRPSIECLPSHFSNWG